MMPFDVGIQLHEDVEEILRKPEAQGVPQLAETVERYRSSILPPKDVIRWYRVVWYREHGVPFDELVSAILEALQERGWKDLRQVVWTSTFWLLEEDLVGVVDKTLGRRPEKVRRT